MSLFRIATCLVPVAVPVLAPAPALAPVLAIAPPPAALLAGGELEAPHAPTMNIAEKISVPIVHRGAARLLRCIR